MLLDLPEFHVSREILNKINIYKTLLLKWQKSINLVSAATLPDIDQRHFDDSIQLTPLILNGGSLCDIGSGAGFPGLVLANFIPTHLVESDQKKCQFLKTVSREADIPVTIHNSRVENVDIAVPDIVTARALASLNDLLNLTEKWWSRSKTIKLIFLKGLKIDQEINDALQYFQFNHLAYQSLTDPNGRIIVLTDINRIP